MTELLLAAGAVYLTYKVLEGGFALKPGQIETNWSGRAIVLAVLSIGAGVYIAGPLGGPALVLGIALHEYGHVAAFRAMGHTDARFRMIPFLGGVAISQQAPRNQLADFYISIMGPGIMLAPLVVCGAIISLAGTVPNNVVFAAQIMLMITGAINFFNLLPLWPLDGGRIVRAITYGFWPRASFLLTGAMGIALAGWAIYTGRWLILIVAIFGLSSLRQMNAISSRQPPMTGGQATIALIAYLCAMAAHWVAGAPMILALLFPAQAG